MAASAIKISDQTCNCSDQRSAHGAPDEAYSYVCRCGSGMEEIMKNIKEGRRGVRGLRTFVAALLAALVLAMPVAAATITTDDVVIRNSPEDKGQENSIGSLNTGDTVTVLDSATDSTGIQWYLVELPNKNRGYVKAQWVSEDGTVPENPQQEEQTQQEETQQEDAQQQEAQQETVEDSGTEQVGETPDAIDDFTPDELKESDREEKADDAEKEESADGKEKDGEKASDSQESPDLTGGDSYNPFTDPEAHYSMHFYTENDGTGEWYIYNYDTDSRIRIGDLEELNTARTAAEKNASSAKIWRTIACILLILLIVVLVLLYMIIKRNSPAPRRRSGVSSRRRSTVDDDDDDFDEFDYSDEDDDDTESEDDESSEDDSETDEEEEPAEEKEPAQVDPVPVPMTLGNTPSSSDEEYVPQVYNTCCGGAGGSCFSLFCRLFLFIRFTVILR